MVSAHCWVSGAAAAEGECVRSAPDAGRGPSPAAARPAGGRPRSGTPAPTPPRWPARAPARQKTGGMTIVSKGAPTRRTQTNTYIDADVLDQGRCDPRLPHGVDVLASAVEDVGERKRRRRRHLERFLSRKAQSRARHGRQVSWRPHAHAMGGAAAVPTLASRAGARAAGWRRWRPPCRGTAGRRRPDSRA